MTGKVSPGKRPSRDCSGATTQKGDRTRELREEKGKIERRLRSLDQQGGSIWLREL